ncbi:zinc carboxypeptidase [Monomorium pharaonis]|uniref:zinc carboxypeptidase n=1 Tax=Monomorium pharaonis TaxID=307658 RepID=UPI00063F79CA|nr:zinc carboxypeptidase [Monomorium pharaonis]XP_036144147.1 zinc carboxypeptidase [Monomorium pharaonis]
MWRIIALFIIITGLAVAKVTYENYKLFSLVPASQAQLSILHLLKHDGSFNYWQEPSFINQEVDIMVPPHKLTEFTEILSIFKFSYTVKIENIQELVDKTIPQHPSKSFNFKDYHRFNKINLHMIHLAREHDNVEYIPICCTYKNYIIGGVHIKNGEEKPTVFIEGGMHGREWISPATVMYILQALLTSNDMLVRRVAESHNWYIFPVLNPDGYEYTFTDDRLWSKTLQPSSAICNGSDLNRNWGYLWNNSNTIKNPCAENYPGSKPFSEREIESISIFMSKRRIDTYVSFQSYGQKLMIPYAYTLEHTVPNYDWLMRIATEAANVLKWQHGTHYQVGTVSNLTGIADGTSIDYVTRILNKPIAFVYKLRDTSRYGYLLPPEEIVPTGEETLKSLMTLLYYITEKILN